MAYTPKSILVTAVRYQINHKLRHGQSIVDFDAADNCRLYVMKMKPMSFQDDVPSNPIDKFKDRYVLVFDLTSMQGASENGHYSKLVVEPLRLGRNFEHVTEHVFL